MYKSLIDIADNIESKVLNNQALVNANIFYAIYPIDVFVHDRVQSLIPKVDIINHDFIVNQVSGQLVARIKNRFLTYVLRQEFHVAKQAELVTDFGTFFTLTATKEWLEYANEKYPLLFHRLETFTENMLNNARLIVDRYCQDYYDLCCFIGDLNNPKLTKISLFLGDDHRGGQSVSKLCLGGIDVFYKPRSQANELEFFKFMKFYEHMVDIDNIIPESLSRREYSWVKGIIYKPFESIELVRDYYYKIGFMQCVFYILGTKDVISDNIIASENHLTFIDLESLTTKGNSFFEQHYVQSFIMDSVKQTGIIPHWSFGNDFKRNIYLSALSADGVSEVHHLPTLNGSIYAIKEDKSFRELFVEGFNDCYKYTLDHKDDLSNWIVINNFFCNTFVRLLFHFTSVYEGVLQHMLHPECFVDMTEINNIKGILSRTIMYFASKQDSEYILNDIMNQLYSGDIPFFYTYANSNSLYCANNKISVSNFFTQSSQQIIFEKIKCMCESDRRNQELLIDGSLQLLMEENISKEQKGTHTACPKSKHSFLDGAVDIANKMINSHSIIDNHLNWIAKTKDEIDSKYDVIPLVYDLYSGLSGIGVFFVSMYKCTGDVSYFKYAIKILDDLKEVFVKQIQNKHYDRLTIIQKHSLDVSGYTFPMSGLVLMKHISDLDGLYMDIEFYEMIQKWYLSIINDVESCDFLRGHSGALVTFMMYKDIAPNSLFIKILNRISDRAIHVNNCLCWECDLDDSEKKRLNGFAHGTSGIAYSLSLLEESDSTRTLINGALAYDDYLFDKSKKQWKDLRNLQNNEDFMAWCHGSTGIALSRLLFSKTVGKETNIIRDIEFASQNIMKSRCNSLHGLCHGIISNADVLRACGTFLCNQQYIDVATKWMEQTRDIYFNSPERLRFTDGKNTLALGLFDGLSGIGYEFLRFYNWENVPSILSLEHPSDLNSVLHT